MILCKYKIRLGYGSFETQHSLGSVGTKNGQGDRNGDNKRKTDGGRLGSHWGPVPLHDFSGRWDGPCDGLVEGLCSFGL